MESKLELQDSLRSHFTEILNNPTTTGRKVSLRQLAHRYGVDPTLLRKFLAGKRRLGKKTLLSVARKLGEKHFISQSILQKFTLKEEKNMMTINDQEEIFDEWYYFTIGEYMRMTKVMPDAVKTAQALGISEEECKKAIQAIIQTQAIKVKPDGRLDIKAEFIHVEQSEKALVNCKKGFLKKALKQIEGPQGANYFGVMEFTFDVAQFPKIKYEIENFKRRIYKLNQKPKNPTGVFNLLVAFNPSIEFR